MTMDTMQAEGLQLTGEYRRAWKEADQTATDGTGKVYPGRFKVRFLANDRTMDVEYREEQTALDALRGAERGDVVTVPVGVRSAKGYTFFYGRTGGQD